MLPVHAPFCMGLFVYAYISHGIVYMYMHTRMYMHMYMYGMYISTLHTSLTCSA
jgi:hypothetical protein